MTERDFSRGPASFGERIVGVTRTPKGREAIREGETKAVLLGFKREIKERKAEEKRKKVEKKVRRKKFKRAFIKAVTGKKRRAPRRRKKAPKRGKARRKTGRRRRRR